jgi:large subunit ribosomal protein L1
MPSERRGTVTDKIKEYIDTLKGSKEWRGDKHGTIRLPVGKVRFLRRPARARLLITLTSQITYPAKHVTDNVKALVQSVRVATNTNVPDGVAAPDPNKPRASHLSC